MRRPATRTSRRGTFFGSSTLLMALGLAVALVVPGAVASASSGDCGGQGNAQLTLVTDAPAIGTRLEMTLVGQPLARFSLLADTGPGPSVLPRYGTLCLDLGSGLRVIADGIRQGSPRLDGDGRFELRAKVPNRPSFGGRTFYVQAAIFDRSAPNDTAISNMVPVTLSPAVVERFDSTAQRDTSGTNAIWAGDGQVVGTFRSTQRVHTYAPQDSGFSLPQPLIAWNDPNTTGCRFQMKFSSAETGARPGESIVGMAWSPRSDTIFQATYRDMTLKLGQFWRSATSDLDSRFDRNYGMGESGTVMFQGDYALPDANNRPWVAWPSFQTRYQARYDEPLIVEVDLPAGAETFQLFRNRSTSSAPRNRIFGDGGSEQSSPARENTTYHTQFTYIRDRSIAQSKYYYANSNPDYRDAILTVRDRPSGTGLRLEFQGAADFNGDMQPDPNSETAWVEQIDSLDGQPLIRFRIVLAADLSTGAVPVAGSVVIPFD